MSRRIALFGGATLGAFAVSAGVVAGIWPFESAHGETPGGASSAEDSRIAEALNRFEPGALVKPTESGGVSITGRVKARDALQRMNDLEKAGPSSIRCSGSEAPFTCVSVPDNAVVPALKRGETIYGRTVYGDIPEGVGTTGPMFSADELVCSGGSPGARLSCTPVSSAKPALAAGETAFATYKPFHVTFEGDRIIGQGDTPTIPLRRASQ